MAYDIRKLLQSYDLRDLPLARMHLIMAIRLCAICSKVGRDPLEEMTIRFRSVTAAKAMLDLAGEVGRAWPEPFMINRPCCATLSPDEILLASLIGTASERDESAFARYAAGFLPVRANESIFTAIIVILAALSHQASCTAKMQSLN